MGGACSMPVGEKCVADFSGANHLDTYIYRRDGNKRILKMGWDDIVWNYVD